MTVPEYQSLMLPVLSVVGSSEGEVRIGDVIRRLEEQLELTAEDRAKLLPSGRQGLFENRVHWAKFYLGKACLIEATRRGYFKITARGKQVLETNLGRIDNNFLSQFDEFRQFKEKSAQNTAQETGSMEPILPSSQTETPDESMRMRSDSIGFTSKRNAISKATTLAPVRSENFSEASTVTRRQRVYS